MDWTVVAIVFATLFGPVFAVQAQKWVERSRAVADRRRQIFNVLMSTRATRLSAAHVEALNAIPVEFYGPRKAALKSIVDDWHAYLNQLNVGGGKLEGAQLELWNQRRSELLVDLLFGMSKYLGYDFSKAEIQTDVYYPQGHVEVENEQAIIRRGFAKLLNGELALPMAVKEFPVSPEIAEKQLELQKLLREWLDGSRSVIVRQQ